MTDEAPVSSAGIAFPSLPNQKRREHTRDRSASDGAALVAPEHKLSPYHPAWSLTSLLDQFGPLIFPIHRAALLRQRILISCHAPVHEICDFGRAEDIPLQTDMEANKTQYITFQSCPIFPCPSWTFCLRVHPHSDCARCSPSAYMISPS